MQNILDICFCRSQCEVTGKIAEKIKDNWKPPETGLLHWDGKLMSTLANKDKCTERLPVLLSGLILSNANF